MEDIFFSSQIGPTEVGVHIVAAKCHELLQI
jgi:hypothetical protein